LEGVRTSLAAAPVPSVQLDVSQLLQTAAARRIRQARHWRRVAIAVAAVAAALLVVVGLRLEVRLEAHQLVLRWGDAPPTPLPEARTSHPVEARPTAGRG